MRSSRWGQSPQGRLGRSSYQALMEGTLLLKVKGRVIPPADPARSPVQLSLHTSAPASIRHPLPYRAPAWASREGLRALLGASECNLDTFSSLAFHQFQCGAPGRKKMLSWTSLAVQWLSLCFKCRGPGFDPWLGN